MHAIGAGEAGKSTIAKQVRVHRADAARRYR